MEDLLSENQSDKNLSKGFLIRNAVKRFCCWIGIHRYKWTLVHTKKDFFHCRGIEEMGHDKELHWHEGRECKHCQKKQYFYYYWVTCGWRDVIL